MVATSVEPASLSQQASGDQERILAVGSDPQTLMHVGDALSKAGYLPILTDIPEGAPRLVEKKRPQAVLLDMLRPGSEGLRLREYIMETADVPVIFLSV